MFLKTSEVNVELMEVLKESSERSTLGHLSEGIDILREALATIAELAVRTWDVGVGVVDVARQQHACMYRTPICTHLLAIFAASIEVGYLVCTKHIVHVFSELCLQWSHYSKLLTNENLCEQLMRTGEYHRLLLEILYVGALGEELWHVVYAMAGLLAEEVAGAWEDGGAHEDGYVRKG